MVRPASVCVQPTDDKTAVRQHALPSKAVCPRAHVYLPLQTFLILPHVHLPLTPTMPPPLHAGHRRSASESRRLARGETPPLLLRPHHTGLGSVSRLISQWEDMRENLAARGIGHHKVPAPPPSSFIPPRIASASGWGFGISRDVDLGLDVDVEGSASTATTNNGRPTINDGPTANDRPTTDENQTTNDRTAANDNPAGRTGLAAILDPSPGMARRAGVVMDAVAAHEGRAHGSGEPVRVAAVIRGRGTTSGPSRIAAHARKLSGDTSKTQPQPQPRTQTQTSTRAPLQPRSTNIPASHNQHAAPPSSFKMQASAAAATTATTARPVVHSTDPRSNMASPTPTDSVPPVLPTTPSPPARPVRHARRTSGATAAQPGTHVHHRVQTQPPARAPNTITTNRASTAVPMADLPTLPASSRTATPLGTADTHVPWQWEEIDAVLRLRGTPGVSDSVRPRRPTHRMECRLTDIPHKAILDKIADILARPPLRVHRPVPRPSNWDV